MATGEGGEDLVGPWVTVSPEDALGDRYQTAIDCSDAALAICEEKRDPTKALELVGNYEWLNNLGDILTLPRNEGILRQIEEDQTAVADLVKIAKVTHPEHPAYVQANLFLDPSIKRPGHTLYVSDAVRKGTILGSLAGTVMLGREADASISNEQEGSGQMREAELFDLEGSLAAHGGWVTGDRITENANMLVLDPSNKSNALSLLKDNQKEPYCSWSDKTRRGTGNVKWVQVRYNNLPRVLAVAVTDMVQDDELMLCIGKEEAELATGVYRRAKNTHDLQKGLNELLDKKQEVDDRLNYILPKSVNDNRDVKDARHAALLMKKEWKEMVADADAYAMPRDEVGSMFRTHIKGSLRSEVYEDLFEGDDEELAETLSEHQKLVYDDNFTPKKAKEIERKGEKKVIMVDNTDCKEFMDILDEYGTEIAHEIGRAWQEYRDLYDSTKGRKVPWNPKRKRMLENDEIIMAQQAKMMMLAGYKPSELQKKDETRERKKFRTMFKQLKEQAEEEEEDSDEESLSGC